MLFGLITLAHSLVADDRIRHFECFNLVRLIERETQAGKGKEEITKVLDEHCARLDDVRKNICTAINPGQVTKILELMTEKKRPEFICEFLGFARSSGSGRLLPKTQCTSIVDRIRGENGPAPAARPAIEPLSDTSASANTSNPATDDKISRFRNINREPKIPSLADHQPRPFGLHRTFEDHLRPFGRSHFGFRHMLHGPEFCRNLEPEQAMACQMIARLVSRELRDELKSGAGSGEICQKLHDRKLIKLTEAE
jgi:hypothetical protein